MKSSTQSGGGEPNASAAAPAAAADGTANEASADKPAGSSADEPAGDRSSAGSSHASSDGAKEGSTAGIVGTLSPEIEAKLLVVLYGLYAHESCAACGLRNGMPRLACVSTRVSAYDDSVLAVRGELVRKREL